MDQQGNSQDLSNGRHLGNQSARKAYHAPTLINWGDLQVITNSGAGTLSDSFGNAASNIAGVRIRHDFKNNPNLPGFGPTQTP
jgi:hypothetical protein